MERNKEKILLWAFEHSSDGMLITDTSGKVWLVNDAFVKMFGYSQEEVIGKRTTFLKSRYSTTDFYAEMWCSLNSTGEWKGEIVNTKKDGDEIPCFLTITSIISDSGEKLGYLGVEIDLSERKSLESQLIQSEKLASIGEAVATLVHEIRNPLNGIRMNAFLLEQSREMHSPWTEEDSESLELLTKEVVRLQEMVGRVLSFARTSTAQYERVMASDLIDETLRLIEPSTHAAGVSVELIEDDKELTLRCDPDLMKQVLLNIIKNAVEASTSSPEKQVRVRTGKISQQSGDAVSASGQAVVIEVMDSGTGISQDVQGSLFKPFFTTKGKGLGLGLATSQKIIRQHHGTLTAVSLLNGEDKPFKTKFVIALPA
jgi:PAS domain S-box-containing protein